MMRALRPNFTRFGKRPFRRFITGAGLCLCVASSAWAAPVEPAVDAPASNFGDFLAGRFAQSQNETADAADFYARALQVTPDHQALLQQTFLLLAMSGQVDKAAELAEQAMAQNRETDLALTITGVQDLHAGRFAQAGERLGRVSNSDAGAAALRAWASLGEGRPAGQLQHALTLLTPLARDPGLTRMYHLQAGMMAEYAKQPAEAERHYGALVETAASLPVYMVDIIGAFYLRHGKTEEAKTLFEQAVPPESDGFLIDTKALLAAGSKNPPFINSPQEGAAEVLSGIATTIFFSRSPSEAMSGPAKAFLQEQRERSVDLALLLAQLSLHLDPNAPRTRILIGDILSSRDLREQGNTFYQSVKTSSPLYWMGQIKAAENLAYEKKREEALELLKKVAAKHPDKMEPILVQADVLRQSELYEEAAEWYGRAITLSGEADSRNWFLYYGRGICFERSKQWDKAESDLQKALELRPDQPEVLNYLGYSWIEMGHRLPEAMEMIEKAVAQRPNDGYIIDSLGWAHYRLGQYEDAVEVLERAVSERPNDPTINDHLGDALWHAGRRIEAAYQWERALSYEPEAEEAVKIRLKLNGEPPVNKPVVAQPDKSSSFLPL